MRRFKTESLRTILLELSHQLGCMSPGGVVSFEAPSPDISSALFDGELTTLNAEEVRYRSLAGWLSVSVSLGADLGVPILLDDEYCRFFLRKLDSNDSWHLTALPSGDPEKYGVGSGFERINKLEDPTFLASYAEALQFLELTPPFRILALGANRGHELALLSETWTGAELKGSELIGIDHSETAINWANEHYGSDITRFEVANIATCDFELLGKFDLIIAINTLHSPRVDGHHVLRRLVKTCLTPRGGFCWASLTLDT